MKSGNYLSDLSFQALMIQVDPPSIQGYYTSMNLAQ